MANDNSIYSDWNDEQITVQLRECWFVISEVQLALDHDEEKYQDRRNRFVKTLELIVQKMDDLLRVLEERRED